MRSKNEIFKDLYNHVEGLDGSFEQSKDNDVHMIHFDDDDVHVRVALKLNKEKLTDEEKGLLWDTAINEGYAVVIRYWSDSDLFSLSEYDVQYEEVQPLINNDLDLILKVLHDFVTVE